MDIDLLKNLVEARISSLNSTLTNLRKAPNRKYRRKTLRAKLSESREDYNFVINNLAEHESKFSDSEFIFLTKCTRELYSNIHTIILTKLEFANIHQISIFSLACALIFVQKLKLKIRAKMAAPKVDIRLGTTLVQPYDGAPESLDSFTDAVNLFNDTVVNDFATATADQQAASHITVLRFVKTRLSGVARQVVADANDLPALLANLREHCESKLTSDNLIAKLKTVKQKDSAENFCNEVEKLTSELKSVYIREQIPVNRANIMATKKGVEALINGVKNNETKTILKAGTFTKMNDASQKLLENESSIINNSNGPHGSSAQVFTSRVNYTRGRGGTSHRGRGNYSRGNNSNNHHSYRGFFSNPRGNWTQRGNSSHRGNWSQRGRFTPNMFIAQSNGTSISTTDHTSTTTAATKCPTSTTTK